MSRRTSVGRTGRSQRQRLFLKILLVAPPDADRRLDFRSLASFCELRTIKTGQLPNKANVLQADLILVDVAMGDSSVIRSVRLLREISPGVPIIGYADLTPKAAHLLIKLAHVGMDDVILRGSATLFQHVVDINERMVPQRVTNMVSKRLQTFLAPALESVISSCLRHGRSSFGVRTLAADLGIAPRTLSKRLAQAGLPTAAALLSWSRLIQAGGCLQGGQASVESVGLALGFGSGTALRNMLRRYTGMSCGEIRTHDGLSRIISMFCDMIVRPDDQPKSASSLLLIRPESDTGRGASNYSPHDATVQAATER